MADINSEMVLRGRPTAGEPWTMPLATAQGYVPPPNVPRPVPGEPWAMIPPPPPRPSVSGRVGAFWSGVANALTPSGPQSGVVADPYGGVYQLPTMEQARQTAAAPAAARQPAATRAPQGEKGASAPAAQYAAYPTAGLTIDQALKFLATGAKPLSPAEQSQNALLAIANNKAPKIAEYIRSLNPQDPKTGELQRNAESDLITAYLNPLGGNLLNNRLALSVPGLAGSN